MLILKNCLSLVSSFLFIVAPNKMGHNGKRDSRRHEHNCHKLSY